MRVISPSSFHAGHHFVFTLSSVFARPVINLCRPRFGSYQQQKYNDAWELFLQCWLPQHRDKNPDNSGYFLKLDLLRRDSIIRCLNCLKPGIVKAENHKTPTCHSRANPNLRQSILRMQYNSST